MSGTGQLFQPIYNLTLQLISVIYLFDGCILYLSEIFDGSYSKTPVTPYIVNTICSVTEKELYIWYEILDCEVK